MKNMINYGGILRHGIPEFRLNRDILDKQIEKILSLGIQVKYGVSLGKDYLLEDLEKEYDAIFLAFGANISSKMGIQGEELEGVYGGNELLENNTHPDYTNKKVAIIGGGNVAMDTARTIKRKGAEEVTVIYRRAEKQMPAEQKEIEDAKKEGETREVPVDIIGSNYELPMDYVVMAVGSKIEEELVKSLGVELTPKGNIKIDENYMTSKNKVFAGGDLSGTKATVAWASRSGRDASAAIMEFLEK